MNKQIKTIMLIGMMLATAAIANARPECESYGLNGYCNKWKGGADVIVTSYRIIENKRLEYEKESGQLSSKKKLGLEVDDNKIRILKYQIDSLEYISRIQFGLSCSSGNLRCDGTTGLVQKYQQAKNALNSKTISQEEFETIISQIKKDNDDLIKKQELIMTLTTTPKYVGEEYKELCGTSVNAVGTPKKSGSYGDVLKNASDTIELGRQFKGLMNK
jgi:hypothetical protein